MHNRLNVTAIVPCHNEASTIGEVLKVLTSLQGIGRVIVIDNCSTDGTGAVVRKFNVELVSNSRNLGKSGSIRKAVAHVRTAHVMLCDADLKGLRRDSIESLLKPLQKNSDMMVIGLRDGDWHRSRPLKGRNFTTWMIGGERVLRTAYLRAACRNPLSEDYGLEPVLNFYCKQKGIRVEAVNLENVRDVSKLGKPAYGAIPLIKEVMNVVGTYAKLYANEGVDSIAPYRRKPNARKRT